MRHNLLEALMGAIVLTVAAIFLGFAYTTSQTSAVRGYHLSASFNRIDGLNLGGDVKLSGVKVGTITKIDIDPQTYQAAVTFSVRSDLLLPEDSSAEITSESLLGGKYLALVPGGSEAHLTEGQSIENTQSSLSFEGLISKFILNQGEDKKAATKSTSSPTEEAPDIKEETTRPVHQKALTQPPISNQPAISAPPVADLTPFVSKNNSLVKNKAVNNLPRRQNTPAVVENDESLEIPTEDSSVS